MKPTKARREWLALETSLEDELKKFWGGDWGCDSEVGTLKAVLLGRPGKEIEKVKDPKDCRWLHVMDAEKARRKHDSLAELYRSQGVKVHYVEWYSFKAK